MASHKLTADEWRAAAPGGSIDMGGTASTQVFSDGDFTGITPIQSHGGYWVKRDDMFQVAGVRGGKVRTCWGLAQGANGLVTAGSRQSPQVNIVASIAKRLGIPCRVHTPEGELSPEVKAAETAGAVVIQHKAGYNNVIIARAREDAAAQGWREIPFGMECPDAVKATATQVVNIPDVQRIVMPVGSGMSLAGVLTGLVSTGRHIPVLGVIVGSDPTKRLDQYAPDGWRDMVELVKSDLDYHAHAPNIKLGDLTLDPIYEAKCIPFLKEGDLLWVVGIRQTAVPTSKVMPEWVIGDSADVLPELDVSADFVFSCPPYFDLETYSDDPADLSTMNDEAFEEAYRVIIAEAVHKLKPNRFACFVVGDVRDSAGNYRGLPMMTIRAFENAGARLYNEAVFLSPVGSLAVRCGIAFKATRKLAKGHQNVLIFVKGDPRIATEEIGPVEVMETSGDDGEE